LSFFGRENCSILLLRINKDFSFIINKTTDKKKLCNMFSFEKSYGNEKKFI